MLHKILAHPLTKGLGLDDPKTTHLRIEIIKSKPFLKKIYQEWYEIIRAALPEMDGAVLEIGSGAGFLDEYVPNLVASEIFLSPNITAVLDAQCLPLKDQSLRGVVMVNVLHHLPQCRAFFKEAARCAKPGGVIVMIEPWVTGWSTWVYQNLHHEPFNPHADQWEFPPVGPLSGANGALPWILFRRDAAVFCQEFPEWEIAEVRPFLPLRYLFSGGVSLRQLAPGWSHPMFCALEKALEPWMDALGMFAVIRLVRRS